MPYSFIDAEPADLQVGDTVNFHVHGTPSTGLVLRRSGGGGLMAGAWYVTRADGTWAGGISEVKVRREITVGQRVVLASRYEIDAPGRHTPGWDDHAVVGQTGVIESFDPPRDRQIAEVRWDHNGRTTRIWLGCLKPLTTAPAAPPAPGVRTVESVLASPSEGDTYRDGRGDFWIYRGSGWDYRPQVTRRAPGHASREQRDRAYVEMRGGPGRLLTPEEEEREFGMTELTRARRELEALRAQHQQELVELGDKASLLGRQTGMCTVLEQFMDEHGIPHRGVPVTGTVTVTYTVSGHIPRDRGHDPARAVRVDGTSVIPGFETVVLTPTVTANEVTLVQDDIL